jgi:hypothetical protein
VLPITIAIWDGGTTSIHEHLPWLQETLESGRTVLVLDVSGAGNITPLASNPRPLHDYKGFVKKLGEDLIGLGDSLAALRAYDVTRAVDACAQGPEIDDKDVELLGHGRHSIYALLAGAVESRINSLRADGGWEGFAQFVSTREYQYNDITSVVIPGVLRHFDLPDLRRWVNNGANGG